MRKLSSVDGPSNTTGFTYDVMGNVLTATDAKNVTITNTYDKANRVTSRTYSNEPQGVTTPAVHFYYDGKGLAAQQSPNFAKGKLTRVENGISATEYMTFDNFGRLTRSRQITDGVIYGDEAHPITYTYNLSGALVQETYPSGRVVKNDFESDGDLARIYGNATVGAPERTYANTFSYVPDGRIEKLKLGNGLWEAAKFNDRLQVTKMALGHGVESGDLWQLGYEFGEIDANGDVDATKNTGNVARQTLNFNGLPQPFVTTYKYDSLYRLTEAQETQNSAQTWKEAFSYDRYGNRIGLHKFIGTTELTPTSLTHPTIDEHTNRFSSGQGFAFDKNGNVVTDPTDSGRSFVFNGDNKQTEVRDANNNLIGEYFYDGEGKRIKKKTYNAGVLNETTVFVYSSGKLVAEYSTAAPSANPTTQWTVTDQLGSPRILTNSLGEVVSRRDFMPFGEEISPDGIHRTSSLDYNFGDGIRQKFTGYERDAETGLDFAEARMYENRHGRFTAVDPLLASGNSANPQTFNRYVYVLNNPLLLTDPKGLQAGEPLFWIFKDLADKTRDWIRTNVMTPEDRENGYVRLNDPYTATVISGSDKGKVATFNLDGTMTVLPDNNGSGLLPPSIEYRAEQEIKAATDGLRNFAYSVSPDYFKVGGSLPGLGGIELSMSKDFRFYFGGAKGIGDSPQMIKQLLDFNVLDSARPKSLGLKAGFQFSAGYFLTTNMTERVRHNAMSGTNISGSVPILDLPVSAGFSQNWPTNGQTILTAPRAIELGFPPTTGVQVSTSGEVFPGLSDHIRRWFDREPVQR